jgi:L-asparagine transporter-like permease
MESGQSKATGVLVLAFTLMVVAVIMAFVEENIAAIVCICVSAVLIIGFFVYVLRLQERWKHTPGHTYGDLVLPQTQQSRQTHVPM